jgi:type VI secretion system Hcp family effector
MKLILLLIFLALIVQVSGQVAINTDGSNPDASAILDLQSTVKGFLIPRMTETQRDIIQSPATGLLIYQIDGISGFYYNTGSPVSPAWSLLSSPSTSTLWIRTGINTTSLAIPTDSVGIGRFNPVEKLNVNGNLALDNFQPMILFREDTLEGARITHIGLQNDGYLHLQAWDGNHFETTGLVVKSPAQNVGVGTIHPAYKLDVAGTAHMSGFILSTSTQDGYVLTSDEAGNGTWQPAASHMVSSGTPNYLARFASADSLINSTVYQNSSGNIGIGTTSPATRLDVNGKLSMRDNIRLNGNWLSGDGGNEGVYVSGDGKVGIGTNSPASALTSGGMIQTMAGGVKFPDNTVQTTAAVNQTSLGPENAAESRHYVAMEITGMQGPLNINECNNCSKVFDLRWNVDIAYDNATGIPMNNDPQHHVVTVYKDVDGMSIPLIISLHQKMPIQHVYIKFFKLIPPNNLVKYYEMRLDDAYVVDFRHNVSYTGSPDLYAHMDVISFSYSHVEWTYLENPPLFFDTEW